MNIFGFRPFKGKFSLGNSDDIPTNNDGTLIGAVKQINNDLSVFSFRDNEGQAQYSMDNGVTWVDFKHPAGTLSITANGTYDVTDYASANVSVPRGNLNFQSILNDVQTSGVRNVSCNIGDIVVFAGGVSLRSGATTLGTLYSNAQFTFVRATNSTVSLNCSGFCTIGRIY